MVDMTTLFFLVMSFLVIFYLIIIIKANKRINIFIEFLYLGIYGFIFLIFLFPNILHLIESTLGINSAINFILYLSIFVAYFLIFLLFKKFEEQRYETTKLVSKIALMNKKK